MRQTHGPAEKLFVDFAGDTVPVFDAAAWIKRRADIFVAVLGGSNYTFAEARWSEGLADWIGAHVKAFSAIGGVPKTIVCDNLTSPPPVATSPGSTAPTKSGGRSDWHLRLLR
jgi:transposase